MRLFGFLCNVGIHQWRGDAESIAKRYRHNTFWDKTQNRLDGPRALAQTCKRCGRKRKWSFNRGKWRDHHEEDEAVVDTSAAWRTTTVGTQHKG